MGLENRRQGVGNWRIGDRDEGLQNQGLKKRGYEA